MSIFSKIVLTICLLMMPVLFLYTHSFQLSTQVVKGEIIESSLNRLSFFNSQVSSLADQLWKVGFTMMNDPDILKLKDTSKSENMYESLRMKEVALEKLRMQRNTISLDSEIAFFSPLTDKSISSNSTQSYNMDYFKSSYIKKWHYQKMKTDQGEGFYFVRHLTDHFVENGDIDRANLITEVAFSADGIIEMLDALKEGSKGDPFFYHPEFPTILNSSSNIDLVNAVTKEIQQIKIKQSGYEMVTIKGQEYILNYDQSDVLDWYIVDFIPVKQVLLPMTYSRNVFYVTIGLLLVVSIISAGLLYRNVQVPIKELIRGVQHLKAGDYAFRVVNNTKNEFQYLFAQFNRMAEELHTLIEKVHKGEIAVREASLKQLQSQINPHFLYNSFAFIQSMAQLKNYKGIIAATQHLSKYYRYTTRIEKQEATLLEEVQFVENYLMIHKLQMHRLEYSIMIPEEMLDLKVPRLIVQPIVENAVIHGVEPKVGPVHISIKGLQTDTLNQLFIEDNGIGMDHETLEHLKFQLTEIMDDQVGCGLWNVQQRLKHQFGPNSGLDIDQSPSGGLLVSINMNKEYEQFKGEKAEKDHLLVDDFPD